MIRSFHDEQTEDIFRRERVKGFTQDVRRAALRKLVILDAAESLDDLRVPPGNRLEKLKGDRKGQYSPGSMISGVSVSIGLMAMLTMSK